MFEFDIAPYFTILYGVAGLLIAFGGFQYLTNYLGSASLSSKRYNSYDNDPDKSATLSMVLRRLNEIQRPLEPTSSVIETIANKVGETLASRNFGLSADETTKIAASVIDKVNMTLSGTFISAIEEKYSSAIVKSAEASALFRAAADLQERLSRTSVYLGTRATTNLLIGIGTTALAAFGLIYVVFASHEPITDSTALVAYYLPRLSFIVFIEVFAYFFLRLYKGNIDDVKYYQNELTNVEAKVLALRSALVAGNPALIRNVAETLAKTERNNILRKGKSTLELERAKLDNTQTGNSIAKVLEMFKAVSKER